MISVIVPVYNPGKYLKTCIESILNQSYKDLEIIFINDGSTDGSDLTLAEYAQKDSRIVVITQENQGVSSARNKGIEIAKGDYITFVDSDDELDPQMYETLNNLAVEHNADIAHCGYRRVYQNGSYTDFCGTYKTYTQDSTQALNCLLTGTLFVGSLCNKIYKKQLFNGVSSHPQFRINEDILMNFHLFRNANHTVFIDAPLYYYNYNINSSSVSAMEFARLSDMCKVSEIIFNECKGTELLEVAAKRYFSILCTTYRKYIFESIRSTKNERKSISNKISLIKKSNISIGSRNFINYYVMRFCPWGYKLLYSCYDRIRTPNIDVNKLEEK